MDWRLILGAVALILGALAMSARADPVEVEWRNAASVGMPPATDALLCAGPLCSRQSVNCAPQETCRTTFHLPSGTYAAAFLYASYRGMGGVWSAVSPRPLSLGPLVVEAADPVPSTLRHDANGDGCVTVADFGSFWAEYGECR